ncbi:hypothetical protein A2Z00_05120 [Candidatus Gottesmanbacteria bacterium RBG_13_45_10]|uniref:Uncharacterized protein n=1 Tax=Candidatus Gottesmanbacteria bacterium RBG_13_45_10 TaxID=1798370 RepID=A0A1F5ZGR7_9BACT|nr:MAG: hypothetical protein A2Z00_05120 [Candidatus Gottesmanbacteria bacterium RBG_13_45_10]
MSSLTETAYYTRKAINWTILGVISYIILRMFWSLFIILWFTIFPPKPPPPNHAFSRLPAIQFPAQASPSAGLTFQLQTIQGTVPIASSAATVYFMPKAAPDLLALNKTQDFAQRLLFDPTPIQESKNIYRFNDAELPLRRLRYDIVSGNFIVRYAFERDASIFNEKNLPLENAAKMEAINFLQTYNIYPDDLAEGTTKISFLRLSTDQLTPTTSLSQADAERVDLFRKSINNMPVFTPKPDEAPVSFIFTGSNDTKKRVLQLAYTYWPIDYQTWATYPLKPSTQAWQELQNGQGYIAHYPTTGNTATVRNVYLGYYDSFDPQTYLQPIFVFEGDYGFLAYVPAITVDWMQ